MRGPYDTRGDIGGPLFQGADLNATRDNKRLKGQILRVFKALQTSGWISLKKLADKTGDGEASVSAQLRNLRKTRHGSHKIEKRHISGGLYEYRLVQNGGKRGDH